MTKFLKYVLAAVTVLVIGSSCNKWLTVKPQDGIIRDDYWKTKEQLAAAVTGCYESLLNPKLVEKLFAWGEIRADMITSTLHTPDDALRIMEDNILSTNTYTDWSVVYQTINNCNTVLQYGPDVINRDATLNDSTQNAYLAEAHAIRGLMYFYLLRTFGEVPLQVTAVSSDKEVVQLEKSSKEDVYNFIMADLKFAEKYIPRSYGNDARNKGRMTKYAVFAMEADAYLWQDQYDSCAVACDSIINSQRYTLVLPTSQEDWFQQLNFNGNSTESIFEFPFDEQALNPFYNMFISSSSQFYASGDYLGDNVFGVDPLGLTFDYRGDKGSYLAAGGTILKFAGASGGTGYSLRASDESDAHWVIYRLPDVMLMKAEALSYLNRGQEALDLINAVRARSMALEVTDEAPDPGSTDDIAKFVLDERASEFAFEGKRWYDLLRYAKRDGYAHLDVLTDAALQNAPNNLRQTIINKYKDVNSHYLPINATELLADRKLVQNPFYGN